MSSAPGHQAHPRLAIVGGGIIGLSVAWRLAQAGCAVTVYDKGGVGQQASWAGAGMLSPGGEVDVPGELASLCLESRRMYASYVRELEEASGLSIDYQECGALELAYSDTEWQAVEKRASRQSELGIHSKPVGTAQVAAFWPRIRSADLVGARFYPDDGLVNPRDVVAALTIACRNAGVALQEHQPVSAIAVSGADLSVTTASQRATHDIAVLAAGAWSGMIQTAGVPTLPTSEPIKGHLIGYHQPAQTCNTILRHGHLYLLQRANGLLIAGASVEHVGFDPAIRSDVADHWAREASFVLPHLAETTPNETWIGFRPGPDVLQIGPWHSDRLYLAYGHYRNGILLAPITAAKLAQQIISSWETRRDAGASHC